MGNPNCGDEGDRCFDSLKWTGMYQRGVRKELRCCLSFGFLMVTDVKRFLFFCHELTGEIDAFSRSSIQFHACDSQVSMGDVDE